LIQTQVVYHDLCPNLSDLRVLRLRIVFIAPDVEQHPVVVNPPAIKPIKGWLEPDHIAFEWVISHFIELL
jgi:hypothetical protein